MFLGFQGATEDRMSRIHTFNEMFEALRCCRPGKSGTLRAKGARVLRAGFRRAAATKSKSLNLSALRSAGHWPTLLTAFLYLDFSFMVWTVLGPLGAEIGESLHLTHAQM